MFRTFSKTRASSAPDLSLEASSDFGPTVVLGRGPSVACFVNVSITFRTVIIANFTSKDLQFPGLSDKISEAENLIFMGNRAEHIPSRRSVSSLPLTAVAWSSLHKRFGRKRKRIIGRLSGLGRKVQSLPSDFSPEIFDRTNNAGMCSVALAASRSNKVHIFGIDFYETGFSNVPNSVGWPHLKEMSKYGAELVEHFEWITKKFPDVEFHLTTQSSRISRRSGNFSVYPCNTATNEEN